MVFGPSRSGEIPVALKTDQLPRTNNRSLLHLHPEQAGYGGARIAPLARDFRSQVNDVSRLQIVDSLPHPDLQASGQEVTDFLPFVEEEVGRQRRLGSNLDQVRFALTSKSTG